MAILVLNRRRIRFNTFDVFVYLYCGIFAIVCFYPLWYVFIGSISPYDSFASTAVALWPTGTPSLRYYSVIWTGASFQRAFLVSVAKTAAGMLGMMTITSCMAYGVSKSHIFGMRFVNVFVVFTMFFGGTIIQYYLLYTQLNMINTFSVMVIPAMVDTWTFVVMRNYFANNIPPDLEQAAAIDGANEITVFFRIVVPISKPIFAAMALFSAVGHWNDWVTYTYYCEDIALQPFTKLLQRLLIRPDMFIAQGAKDAVDINLTTPPPMALKYTTIMCAMIPIMCVYPFLQKYFAKGILIGAIKE